MDTEVTSCETAGREVKEVNRAAFSYSSKGAGGIKKLFFRCCGGCCCIVVVVVVLVVVLVIFVEESFESFNSSDLICFPRVFHLVQDHQLTLVAGNPLVLIHHLNPVIKNPLTLGIDHISELLSAL